MSTWRDLDIELEAWSTVDRQPTLWWRDDDADAPTPALERLFELAAAVGVPLALAVVPAGAGRELAAMHGGCNGVHVLTHGLCHENRASDGERKSEFGPDRPLHEMLADVATGRERLRLLFPRHALPIFVPPWNRMSDSLKERLPNAGFQGLSELGPRSAADPVPGLRQVNCHVDLINWRGERAFVGEAAALSRLIAHLADRRQGRADPDEPTGVMSHHLVHNAAAWRFLEELLRETQKRDRVHWLSAREAFNLTE